MSQAVPRYTEEDVKSLDWREHIRTRPGMYIGRLGDGSHPEDGIYVLLKEAIDNSVDEFLMGAGRKIEITIEDGTVTVRDYGRGIPLGKVVECVSRINTGAKYDGGAFYRSVGLNGVGTKAVNALSEYFRVESYREGKMKAAEFRRGELVREDPPVPTKERSGTLIRFAPDSTIFPNYRFLPELVEERLWRYAYLNRGLRLYFNGQCIAAENGLLDLLANEVGEGARYPIVHEVSDEIEYAFTHTDAYGECYYSFVNGQYTVDGGTHQSAFREGVLRGLKEFYGNNLEASDIRGGFVGAVLVRIHEPVFESQTKTRLGSTTVGKEGASLRTWVVDFVRDTLVRYLHRHPDTAEALLEKIRQNERERKEMAGVTKLAKERQRKANLHNRKLRDCKVHFTDQSHPRAAETQIFITEGDSASGSLTKARDVQTQAVFALKGKPLNVFGLSKKVVYENEELNLLQHALGIEEDLDGLRFNQVIIATDADVDGMHIRLLLLTFFLQFFPELVRKGHLYILQTPLFRVRNKKETLYCYSETEKQAAVQRLGGNPEITRFKGLGEISPDEFGKFIGPDIRLEQVEIPKGMKIPDVLAYYMGKNSPERRDFITENLILEPIDFVEV
ncbi:MAG: DNA topoisomerase IV subunit B [Acidobacteriota bacterium]